MTSPLGLARRDVLRTGVVAFATVALGGCASLFTKKRAPDVTVTAKDGEILHWLGRQWMTLRDEGDDAGLADLERWIGVHTPEIHSLRNSGRWSVHPDDRNSL